MEEDAKKIQRRQRNKEAAARCRQRRLEQTLTLQAEVDEWEEKKADMEKEIEELERQKKELETLLTSHRDKCKVIKKEQE